ncbi:Tfp pilus assembly protein PilN [Legionella nautarum]|uniref:Tfp pilus assembly protein PilN n=1 Tax=Legionella nautarum TaxID=45070 RepID=A0A0W0X436_9GAMM|nr:PilN domain-containing protein [Legionella nautarum]KTD39325.1 Tfp pilus assembly protein PilN [Legionella nautarum]
MLVEINLLPWRQIKRNEEKKKFILILGLGFLLIILLCVLLHGGMASLTQGQNDRIQRLKEEIILVNGRITRIEQIKKRKEELIKRIFFLQNIQNDGYLIIHLFDELTKLIPQDAFLNRMQRNGEKVVLQGIAEFNEKITSLMRNIKRNPWMEKPSLIEIKKAENSNQKVFNLSFILKTNFNKKFANE